MRYFRDPAGHVYREDFRPSVNNLHPVAVIAPEDREQVEHLVKALSTGQPLIGLDPTNREMVDQAWFTHTQTALREFANPTPLKPEEPMGLGAVVQDADGDTWSRSAAGRWLNLDGGSSHISWSDVSAVRVIFKGVTA